MMADGKKGRGPAGSRGRGLMIRGQGLAKSGGTRGRGRGEGDGRKGFRGRRRRSCLALTDGHVVARALPRALIPRPRARERERERERGRERERELSLPSPALVQALYVREHYPLLLTLCVVHARSAATALQPMIAANDVVVVGRRRCVVGAAGPPPVPVPSRRV